MAGKPESTRRTFLKMSAGLTAGSLVAPTAWAAVLGEEGKTAFAPPLGVCTSLKNAGLLQKAGGDYIEAGVRWLLVPDKGDEEFAPNRESAGACPLPVCAANGFLPSSLRSTGPDADHEAVLAFADIAFKRARQVGIQTIVFGSSGSRTLPEGFDVDKARLQFVALLARMAPLAKAQGVTVVVEPLNRKETNFINTLPEGAQLVEPVNHPNIRLLADIFHMMRMEEPPSHIRDTQHLLHHVHIAEKEKRTPPGKMGDDFKPFLRALKEGGYQGRISIECGWKEMDTELPVAIQTLRTQLREL